jgi:hypothetical protein
MKGGSFRAGAESDLPRSPQYGPTTLSYRGRPVSAGRIPQTSELQSSTSGSRPSSASSGTGAEVGPGGSSGPAPSPLFRADTGQQGSRNLRGIAVPGAVKATKTGDSSGAPTSVPRHYASDEATISLSVNGVTRRPSSLLSLSPDLADVQINTSLFQPVQVTDRSSPGQLNRALPFSPIFVLDSKAEINSRGDAPTSTAVNNGDSTLRSVPDASSSNITSFPHISDSSNKANLISTDNSTSVDNRKSVSVRVIGSSSREVSAVGDYVLLSDQFAAITRFPVRTSGISGQSGDGSSKGSDPIGSISTKDIGSRSKNDATIASKQGDSSGFGTTFGLSGSSKSSLKYSSTSAQPKKSDADTAKVPLEVTKPAITTANEVAASDSCRDEPDSGAVRPKSILKQAGRENSSILGRGRSVRFNLDSASCDPVPSILRRLEDSSQSTGSGKQISSTAPDISRVIIGSSPNAMMSSSTAESAKRNDSSISKFNGTQSNISMSALAKKYRNSVVISSERSRNTSGGAVV